jgi:hypothetical protein
MNEALLRDTMDFITQHPEGFVPTIWGLTNPHVGTLADFGGWAVLLDDPADPARRPPYGEPDGRGGWVVADHWMVGGTWMPAYAQQLLGITFEQRQVLFHHKITVAGLQAVVDGLVFSDGESDPAELHRLARAAGAPLDER